MVLPLQHPSTTHMVLPVITWEYLCCKQIRSYHPQNICRRIVSTFAGSGSPGANDGTGTAASFNEPWAVACDTLGNIYVADTKNYKDRKITTAGVVTTVAGTGAFGVTNGPVSVAQFGFPTGIAVNKTGTTIIVSDRMTHTIRKIAGGNVTTLAGVVYSQGDVDGPGVTAKFDHPYSIAMDAVGNIIVADEYNNKIRKVTPAGVDPPLQEMVQWEV